MRPEFIAIHSPRFNIPSGIVGEDEHIGIKTFVPKASVENLNRPILHGFAGPIEIEFDPIPIGQIIQYLLCEFFPIIHRNHFRISKLFSRTLQGRDDLHAHQGEINLHE